MGVPCSVCDAAAGCVQFVRRDWGDMMSAGQSESVACGTNASRALGQRHMFRQSAWCAGILSALLVTVLWSPVSGQGRKKPRVGVPAAETATIPAENATGATPIEVPEDHPLKPAVDLAEESLAVMEAVSDYTAIFSKRELLGSRMTTQVMEMKFRQQPFSVYFKFRGQEAGREVIFVNGRNRGNLLVHETGVAALAGTITIAPTAPEVMKNTRHPITQAGLYNLVSTVAQQWRAESRFGEVEVKTFPNAKLGDVACIAIQTTHPQPRREFKFHMTRLYLERDRKLPVRVEQFGWPRNGSDKPPLVEEYTYTDIRTNVGLTDQDFDHRNPAYGF